MKCIDDELIQKYIDGETSPEEITCIEKHLSNCAACKQAVEEQKELANEMCNILNLLSKEAIEIPAFNKPVKIVKKQRRVMLRWSIIATSAACLLTFIFFKPKETIQENNMLYFYDIEEFDANKSLLQQDMTIKVINSEGNLSEYLF